MSDYRCEFCENESRMICIRCKKDICKDHASFHNSEDGGDGWLCPECHKTSTVFKIVMAIIGIGIFIGVVVFAIYIITNFGGGIFPFP